MSVTKPVYIWVGNDEILLWVGICINIYVNIKGAVTPIMDLNLLFNKC